MVEKYFFYAVYCVNISNLKKNPKLEMVILLIHDKITILIAQEERS